jgi:hypothetical protein
MRWPGSTGTSASPQIPVLAYFDPYFGQYPDKRAFARYGFFWPVGGRRAAAAPNDLENLILRFSEVERIGDMVDEFPLAQEPSEAGAAALLLRYQQRVQSGCLLPCPFCGGPVGAAVFASPLPPASGSWIWLFIPKMPFFDFSPEVVGGAAPVEDLPVGLVGPALAVIASAMEPSTATARGAAISLVILGPGLVPAMSGISDDTIIHNRQPPPLASPRWSDQNAGTGRNRPLADSKQATHSDGVSGIRTGPDISR